jgi:hypothetical protein
MALPTLDKTWIFKTNRVYFTRNNNKEDMRNFHLTVKNMLTDPTGWTDKDGYSVVNSNPWTVSGSSGRNGATSDSGALVANTNDNWKTIYDLVWAPSGSAHSWIVLRQPKINTKFEMCISLKEPGSNSYSNCGYVSPLNGFDLSSPVTTQTPTGTDVITCFPDNYLFTGGNNPVSYNVSCMMSTDGECTRVFAFSALTPKVFWLFDKPKNPVSGWSNPCIFLYNALNGATAATYSQLNDNATIIGVANSSTMYLYATTEAYISATIGENQIYANQLTNEWPLTPIGLASTTPGCYGRHGEIYDMYFTSSVLLSGSSFPAVGAREFMCFSNIVLPWNKTDFYRSV